MSVPSDVLFILILFAALFAATVFFGKAKGVTFLISLYVGTLFFSIFPYTGKLTLLLGESGNIRTIAPILVFGAFVALSFYVIGRALGGGFSSVFSGGWFDSGILAIALLGTLLVILYNVLSFGHLYSLSGTIAPLLVFKDALFWYLGGSLLILLYTLR